MTFGLFMTIFLADVAAGLMLRAVSPKKDDKEQDPSSH